MAAYRYWRVNLRTENPNARVWIQDLQFRGVIGGPDLTTPGGAFTVNQFNAPNIGSRAIDGDSGTTWESSGLLRVAEGTYDFGVPTEVVEIAVLTASAYSTPSAYSWVSASNDQTAWVHFGPTFGSNQGSWVNGSLNAIALTAQADPDAGRVAGQGLRANTDWPSAVATQGSLVGQGLLGGQWVGDFRIAGNVYIDGVPDVPVRRRCRLFDRVSAACVREVWSDALTGAYLFDRLPDAPGRYFVVVDDHTGTFNAVIKDRMRAVAP